MAAEETKKTARKKGVFAAAATGTAVTLIATGMAPVLGVVALVPAVYLGWDWFSYRAKKGLYF